MSSFEESAVAVRGVFELRLNSSIDLVTHFAIDITLRRGGAERVSTRSSRDELGHPPASCQLLAWQAQLAVSCYLGKREAFPEGPSASRRGICLGQAGATSFRREGGGEARPSLPPPPPPPPPP